MKSSSSPCAGRLATALLSTVSLIAALPPLRADLALTEVPENALKDAEAAIEAFNEVVAVEDEEKLDGDKVKNVVYRLEIASSKAQKSPELQYYLSRAYQLAELFSKSKRAISKALKLKSEFPEALVQHGDLLYWSKDYDKALKEYDKALKLVPEHAEALQSKAMVHFKLGRFEEAAKFLDAAQKIEKSKAREGMLARLASVQQGPKWENTYVHETENYVVKSSVSAYYTREMADAVERIRRAYLRVFPKTKRPDRKYTIYIHSSREEYMKNGGPPMAAGHYSPDIRVLELFRRGKAETLTTLNHEAFHQFIDDYMEKPPQWFNEGVADYFGPFEYVPKENAVFPRPNTGRLEYLRSALRARHYTKPADLMQMNRAEMYSPRMIGVHYAQSWSMIWFMLEEKKGQPYRKVLLKYFNALRSGKGNDEAYAATFGRINMDRFEKDWKDAAMSIDG